MQKLFLFVFLALAMQQELINNQRGRKKGRKKSKFRQALEQSQDKPVFDPNDKTFEVLLWLWDFKG